MIAGGFENTASADYATIPGGRDNLAANWWATVGGGASNAAVGGFATVPGGYRNRAAGEFSYAAGHYATANHSGSFVWADFNEFPFRSASENEFSARTTGGARFVSAIDGNGSPTAGVVLHPGAGSWSDLSDRNLKENVQSVDGREVLAKLVSVPIATWNYIAQDDSVRHIGPMAQDLHSAFHFGESEKAISTIDADGISLAAIQGLYQVVQQRDAQIAALQKQNADVLARLEALEAKLAVVADCVHNEAH
jgi:hypothetical protein